MGEVTGCGRNSKKDDGYGVGKEREFGWEKFIGRNYLFSLTQHMVHAIRTTEMNIEISFKAC